MSITNELLREAMKRREYPEGNERFWAIIEGAFTLWCIAVVAFCVIIAVAH